jgi:phage FluMu gp28-like protein
MSNKTIQKWLSNVTLDQVYFNLTFISTANLTVFILQGNTIKTAKRVNVTVPLVNKTLRYQTSKGMSLFIIAFPNNLTS